MQHRHRSSLKYFLHALKEQQDQLKGLKTDICSSLLAKLFNGDTIPIMIKVDGEYYEAAVMKGSRLLRTKYFRIETIDEENDTVTLLLLEPLDMGNGFAASFNELYRLEKTSMSITLYINRISAVQCLDIELMTKKMVIEPKW
ncbi:CotY/CotZ family spore coat protein [Domibacillus indicus]|uniref:CotY/CotZ family spore coat protein n=1 Tax=Domibacillus indicus TaxID=1437523 RepID=UPI000617E85B|nr:CotY/CotZ family spore coat protein [Domibacillus indicus]